MSDIDFEALAAEELPAGESVTETTGEGTEPDPAENTETGETTETDDAGDDAGETDEADDRDKQDDDEPRRRRPSGAERARRQIEALRAENEALKAAQQAPKSSAAGQDFDARLKAEVGDPPKESDFPGDFLAYERAMTAYEADKRAVSRELRRADREAETKAERAAETAKSAAEANLVGLIEEHQDRLRDLEKASPGSVAKINAALQSGKLAPSDALLPILLDSEKSGLIALYLSERPEKVAELNRLSPGKAEREIGRLEARLSLPKPKTATRAAAPITPPRGSATPSADPARMSQAQYEAWRAKGGGR